METIETLEKAGSEGWTDQEIVDRIKAGDTALYKIIMRRYNQRLYRVARAILRDDAEAEDVMQDAYVRAYQHLDQFAGRAPFSAWSAIRFPNTALLKSVMVPSYRRMIERSPARLPSCHLQNQDLTSDSCISLHYCERGPQDIFDRSQ